MSPTRRFLCYHRGVRRLVPLLLILVLSGCPRSKQAMDAEWVPVAVPDLGKVVARVGQVPIYAAQVLAEAKKTGTSPREALEALVERFLLAEQVRRQGWRPATREDSEVRSAMVQRLLERELEPTQRAEAIPDRVLRPFYQKVLSRFVHPRLVKVGVLAVYTGARMKDEARARREKTARDLEEYLKAHPPQSLQAFKSIARDPAWSKRAVLYSSFLQSPVLPLSKQVGEEIVKLKSEGETTPLLSDDRGFYIARYIDERPPENISFEEVRPKLAAGYVDVWRRRSFEEYTAKLMNAYGAIVYYQRLNEQGP
jgi:hypothetical protein